MAKFVRLAIYEFLNANSSYFVFPAYIYTVLCRNCTICHSIVISAILKTKINVKKTHTQFAKVKLQKSFANVKLQIIICVVPQNLSKYLHF